MTKIAFISTLGTAPWGGSEELWSQVALALAKRGADVHVSIVGWPTKPLPIQALEAAGCTITRRPSPISLHNKVLRRLSGNRAFSWLDKVKPDFVIISQGGNFDGIRWMRACSTRRIPYASIAQSANRAFSLKPDMLSLAQQAYADARVAFFVSKGNLQLTEKQLQRPLPNGKVIRNPFNVPYDISVPWSAADENFKLACVGRLHFPAKGQDLLIEVLSQDKWRNRSLTVTLFGEGPDRGAIEEKVKGLGLKNLQLAGFVKDISSVWAQHHGLIMASRYEGLPLAVVEAMLCNRICIVTDVPGNADLTKDGINGFVAPEPNPVDIDLALEKAWALRDNWKAMGEVAGQTVREEVPRDAAAFFIDNLKPQFDFPEAQ